MIKTQQEGDMCDVQAILTWKSCGKQLVPIIENKSKEVMVYSFALIGLNSEYIRNIHTYCTININNRFYMDILNKHIDNTISTLWFAKSRTDW